MMGFLKTLGAWLIGGIVAYILASLSSQFVVLRGLTQLDLSIPLADWAQSLTHAVLNMWAYLIVILIGFAIAFGIARLVKMVAPVPPSLAYPIAGAAAIGAALGLMYAQFGIFPIMGAQETYGLVLQLLAGAAGGVVFEALRHKLSTTGKSA